MLFTPDRRRGSTGRGARRHDAGAVETSENPCTTCLFLLRALPNSHSLSRSLSLSLMLSLTHLAGGASRPRARARAALLRHGVFVLFFVEKGGEKEGKKIVFLCFVGDVELQSLSLLDVDDRATAKPINRKKNPFFFFLNLSLPTAPAALGGSRSHGDPRSVRKNKERMRERENERERGTHMERLTRGGSIVVFLSLSFS